jgi:hypothetical protein
MRRGKTALFVAASALLACLSAFAQNAPRATTVSSNATLAPEEVIRRFTAKESELREIWKDYAYQQESVLQVLGPAKTVSGEFYQVSEFVFNDAGKRVQRILKAPPSTLDRAGLIMTAEDHNAFINLQPFALGAEDLKDYTLNYVGRERIDDLNTYVFDVTPNVMRDPRALDRLKKQKVEGRYFQGRVWVDDQDFQIVKTAGKTVPEFKQRFPRFETYRENIDGRYWLPTYTAGEDTLSFEDGLSINVRLLVRYKNYRKFNSDVKIIDDAVIAPEETTKEPQPGQPQPAPQTKPETKRPDESER